MSSVIQCKLLIIMLLLQSPGEPFPLHVGGSIVTLWRYPLGGTQTHTEPARLGPGLPGTFTPIQAPGHVVIAIAREGNGPELAPSLLLLCQTVVEVSYWLCGNAVFYINVITCIGI